MSAERNEIIEDQLRLQAELVRLKQEKINTSNNIKKVIDNLKELEVKIKNVKNNTGEIVVSDHAILRYLERVENIDLEAVKKKIVTEKAGELINKLGNGVFPVNDIFKITVTNKVVTTVLLNEHKTPLGRKFSDR